MGDTKDMLHVHVCAAITTPSCLTMRKKSEVKCKLCQKVLGSGHAFKDTKHSLQIISLLTTYISLFKN